jgi:hypothetical protein
LQQQQRGVLQLPELQGRALATDMCTVSDALLWLSDSLSLPEGLLEGLSQQLVAAMAVVQQQQEHLATAAAADGAAPAPAAAGAQPGARAAGAAAWDAAAPAGGVQAAQGASGAQQLHAAVTRWYGQLRAAVREGADAALLTQLVQELHSDVLLA